MLNDIIKVFKQFQQMEAGDWFLILWNGTVMAMNIINFVYFVILSRTYDVNTILIDNVYVDSLEMSTMYQKAQLYDSILVIMNMVMVI